MLKVVFVAIILAGLLLLVAGVSSSNTNLAATGLAAYLLGFIALAEWGNA